MRRLPPAIAVILAVSVAAGAWWLTQRPDAPAEGEASPAVARVGDRVVRMNELERAFALRPAWHRGQRRIEAYRSQLEAAVADKLLAQEARAAGLDTLPAVAPYLAFLEDKEVIRALYRRDVLAGVEPDEQALAEAYVRAKRRVRLHYVHTPDAQRAEAYAAQLRAEALRVAEPDREGTTDWLGFGDVPEELEAVVFQLMPGEVAGPVAVRGDYYVVKLLEGEVERFQSERDFAEQRGKLRRALTERRARPVAARYVADVMAAQGVRLDREGFAALGRAFLRVFPELEPNTPLSPEVVARVEEELPLTGRETVVTYAGGSMTAAEVLRELSYLPTSLLRPGRPLAPQLKDAVAVLVRNRFLAARGRAVGLAALPAVRAEAALQQDAFLADLARQRFRDSVTVGPEEVAAFRASATFDEANRRAGGTLDDARLAAVIADYRAAAQEVEAVERLRARYPVTVDEAALRAALVRPDELLDYDPAPIVVREVFE